MIDENMSDGHSKPSHCDMPLVSIVTPAYNAARFIEDTLKSIRDQDYPNIEHIVLDDGSIDNTSDILERYRESYNLRWISKNNEGQTVTVNRGFDTAKGEIVVWLNADDVLFNKQVIMNIVKHFQIHPEVGVVYGHTAILDERNKIVKIQYAIPWLNLENLRRAHFAPGVFYRRNIVLNHKLNPAFNYAMDYEQVLRLCKNGIKFGYINKVLIGYRKHKATKSMRRRADLEAETKRLRKKYGERFGISYYFSKYLDNGCFLVFKVCGIKTVIDLCIRPAKFQLAFDATFDSFPRLVLRQAMPYVN